MDWLIGGPSRALFGNLGTLWSYSWWIILPIFIAPIFWKRWLFYIRGLYVRNLSWTLLAVRVPQTVLKTPKAMEQIFAAAHGTYSFGFRMYNKYWNGEVELWTSFEIVADATGPQFFIRVVSSSKKMIEAAIYAQYPDAEIEEAEDYVEKFPTVLPNDEYDLQGSDFILITDNALPIRTYDYFEAIEEGEKIDTISTLMESLSHHEGEETTWIHVMVRPVGGATSDWIKKAQKFRDDIIQKKGKKPAKWDFIKAIAANIIPVIIGKQATEDIKWPEEKKEEKPTIANLPFGDKEKIEAIDKKTSKLAFETVIRWVYIDRADALNADKVKGISAWARQFIDENLNGLRPNLDTYTVVNRQPFKKRKAYIKKRMIYEFARRRKFPEKSSIMNTEELATIYHFPSATVKTPMLGRIEAKKGTPPPSLPIG